MAARTVDPDTVRTLKDWVVRWPKAGNLAFDTVGRNPVIYSRSAPPQKIKEIPWKREGDTLTVLSQRGGFSDAAVGFAERRMAKYNDQHREQAVLADEQIRNAEQALLEAWRDYRDAEGMSEGSRTRLMRDIIVAEKTLREMEQNAARQLKVDRVLVELTDTKIQGLVAKDVVISVQTAPFPRSLRGMDLADLSASA
jgi:hypothetical protein